MSSTDSDDCEAEWAPPPGFRLRFSANPFPSVGGRKSRRRASSSSDRPGCLHPSDDQRGDWSGGTLQTTRKRTRPQFFDPSPQPSTRRRNRGRPSATHEPIPTNDTLVSEVPLTDSPHQIHFNSPPTESTLQNNFNGLPYAPPTESPHNSDLNVPPPLSFTELSCQNDLSTHPSALLVDSPQQFDLNAPPPSPLTVVPYQHDLNAPGQPLSCKRTNQSLNREEPEFRDSEELKHIYAIPSSVEVSLAEACPLNFPEQVGSFSGNPSLASIIQAVVNKHGDIAKECLLVSGFMRTSVVEGICKVVKELQSKGLAELNDSHFRAYFSALKDAEAVNLKVKWLEERLHELHYAAKALSETKRLINRMTDHVVRKDDLLEEIQRKKVQVEELQSDIKEKECHAILEKMQTEKVDCAIRFLSTKYEHLMGKPLTDGLL